MPLTKRRRKNSVSQAPEEDSNISDELNVPDQAKSSVTITDNHVNLTVNGAKTRQKNFLEKYQWHQASEI